MRLRDQRRGIAEKILSGNPDREMYIYESPTDAALSPAIVVQPGEPVSANFNVSNRMGDEWRWRVWVMVAVGTDKAMAYDDLDDIVYGDNGIRQILHLDTRLDSKTTLVVTGCREYGLSGTFNSQKWITAQVTVAVFTQG